MARVLYFPVRFDCKLMPSICSKLLVVACRMAVARFREREHSESSLTCEESCVAARANATVDDECLQAAVKWDLPINVVSS